MTVLVNLPLSMIVKAMEKLYIISYQENLSSTGQDFSYTFSRSWEFIRDIRIDTIDNISEIRIDSNGLELWKAKIDNNDNNSIVCPLFKGLQVYPINSLPFAQLIIHFLKIDITKPASCCLKWNYIYPIDYDNIYDIITHGSTYENFSNMKLAYEGGIPYKFESDDQFNRYKNGYRNINFDIYATKETDYLSVSIYHDNVLEICQDISSQEFSNRFNPPDNLIGLSDPPVKSCIIHKDKYNEFCKYIKNKYDIEIQGQRYIEVDNEKTNELIQLQSQKLLKAVNIILTNTFTPVEIFVTQKDIQEQKAPEEFYASLVYNVKKSKEHAKYSKWKIY